MRLYHFTCEYHLESILKSGQINRGDTSLSEIGGFQGTPWFTTIPDASRHGWNRLGAHDKTSVRFTVEIPDYDPLLWHWPELAKRLKVKKRWFKTLDSVAGGGSQSWYVYLGPVDRSLWTGLDVKGAESSFLELARG